jgi:hypothetical protein
MDEILPEGEALRKAVRWISERRREIPPPPLSLLVEEACLKFNLSPSDSEFLYRRLVRGKVEEDS